MAPFSFQHQHNDDSNNRISPLFHHHFYLQSSPIELPFLTQPVDLHSTSSHCLASNDLDLPYLDSMQPEPSTTNDSSYSLEQEKSKAPMDRKRKCKKGPSPAASQSKGTKQMKDEKEVEEPPAGYIHVRARRGQATDSHSLAERVRREKISLRMKVLQGLVPGCDKVIGKALMLDEIINYVQSLQNQVEFLSMKLASAHPMQYDFIVDYDDCMSHAATNERRGATATGIVVEPGAYGELDHGGEEGLPMGMSNFQQFLDITSSPNLLVGQGLAATTHEHMQGFCGHSGSGGLSNMC